MVVASSSSSRVVRWSWCGRGVVVWRRSGWSWSSSRSRRVAGWRRVAASWRRGGVALAWRGVASRGVGVGRCVAS
ncbi:hypothetical protein ACXZ9C_11575 [Streptococcus agalactiae]